MQKTKVIKVGNVFIGGTYPVVIQSMTNTKTKDVNATVNQINELQINGCQIVRVACLDEDDAKAIKEIKKQVSVPIVADIHFDYKLAILAIESGADKIRINPGNIGSKERVKQVIDKAKEYNIPIRIGINSGSVEKELLKKYGGPTPEALLESMQKLVKMVEEMDFTNLVLSIKATDITSTLKTNRLLKENFNYPIHIGLTESGTVMAGAIRSSYALGTLLNEGIGDTIRVSLNGNPVNEIPVCKEILSMMNLYNKPHLICCPTCGRTSYNMEKVVNEVEAYLNTLKEPITVAIMGCIVNGPGEATEADIGAAGGIKEAVIFRKGEIIKKVPEDKLTECLIEEINNFINEKNAR